MKKIYQRINEINLRYKAIHDEAMREKRKLTKEEEAEVNELDREKQMLELRTRSVLGPEEPKKRLTKEQQSRKAFRELLSSGRGIIRFRAEGEGLAPETGDGTEGSGSTSTGFNPMMTSDLADSSLIPITVNEILYPLQEELIYNKIGIRMPTGCRGQYDWPVVEAVEAEIAGEGVELEEQKIDLDKVSTITQRIGVSVSATRESLFNSDGKLESIIKTLLPMAIADKMNLILVSPTKVTDSCAITGPFVGNTAVEVAPTFKAFNIEKAKLLAKGVRSNRMCWVMTEALKAELEATPKDAGSGIMCIEDDKFCGLPVFCHNAIGTDMIGLGDFSWQVAGQFGDVYFIVDPITKAKSNSVLFTLNVNYGTSTLRKEAFGLYKIKRT